MKRFKMGLKAALPTIIVGLILVVVGIVLLVIGNSNEDGTGMMIGGLVMAFFGVACLVVSRITARDKMRAICPECNKHMGKSDKSVQYAYECVAYQDHYDSGTGKYNGSTYVFSCTIVCPYCGSSSVFEYKTRSNSPAKAESACNKYLKNLLKLN